MSSADAIRPDTDGVRIMEIQRRIQNSAGRTEVAGNVTLTSVRTDAIVSRVVHRLGE